ncbi:hypothetical protein BDL97_08G131100 [Sphagnum fallax]|nr:hypothetical protein BDL97_08G131100 [Sphagnum fallax]
MLRFASAIPHSCSLLKRRSGRNTCPGHPIIQTLPTLIVMSR